MYYMKTEKYNPGKLVGLLKIEKGQNINEHRANERLHQQCLYATMH